MAEGINTRELNKGVKEAAKELGKLEKALPEVTQGIGKLERGAEEAGSTLAESGRPFTKPEDSGTAGASRLADGSQKALLDNLIKSGMWSMVEKGTGGVLETDISSLLGDTAGSMASHIVSDAGSRADVRLLNATAAGGGIAGAMGGLGSVLGGPVGGLVVGTLFGVAEGIVESFEKQDQAFQDYVKSQYDRVMQEQQAMLQRGTTLAAGDEEYQAAMRGLEEAQNELEKLMGQGFIDTRKDGIQAQKEWLEEQTKQKEEGETGLGLGDAYGLIGSFQASLENDKERLERDALSIVMGDGEKISSYQDSAQRERLEELQAQYQALEEQYGATDSEEMQRKIGAKMGALLGGGPDHRRQRVQRLRRGPAHAGVQPGAGTGHPGRLGAAKGVLQRRVHDGRGVQPGHPGRPGWRTPSPRWTTAWPRKKGGPESARQHRSRKTMRSHRHTR